MTYKVSSGTLSLYLLIHTSPAEAGPHFRILPTPGMEGRADRVYLATARMR